MDFGEVISACKTRFPEFAYLSDIELLCECQTHLLAVTKIPDPEPHDLKDLELLKEIDELLI